MSMIIVYLIIILVIIISFVVMGVIIKIQRDRNKSLELDNKILYQKLIDQQRNLRLLVDHQKAIKDINNNELSKQIKEAKNEEDSKNVISAIISANNKRMHNN